MSSSISSNSRERVVDHSSAYGVDAPVSELEAAVNTMMKQASKYEAQMRELEAKLSEGLSDFRQIGELVQSANDNIKESSAKATRASTVHVPHIQRELQKSLRTLQQLAEDLPRIQTQVEHIQLYYRNGQKKAALLKSDLQWLNKDFYERWWDIIFNESPVSLRWKVFMRAAFGVMFLLCFRLFWLLVAGIYKAHRHRLVWGERLMS